MKLLLDENMPHRLRLEIPGHDCFTVAYMGWSGIDNGELLKAAAKEGFDALVTKDTKLRYEQNLDALALAVVVLKASSNDIDDIRPLLPKLVLALGELPENKVTIIR